MLPLLHSSPLASRPPGRVQVRFFDGDALEDCEGRDGKGLDEEGDDDGFGVDLSEGPSSRRARRARCLPAPLRRGVIEGVGAGEAGEASRSRGRARV